MIILFRTENMRLCYVTATTNPPSTQRKCEAIYEQVTRYRSPLQKQA